VAAAPTEPASAAWLFSGLGALGCAGLLGVVFAVSRRR
jgi:hypothetical protein